MSCWIQRLICRIRAGADFRESYRRGEYFNVIHLLSNGAVHTLMQISSEPIFDSLNNFLKVFLFVKDLILTGCRLDLQLIRIQPSRFDLFVATILIASIFSLRFGSLHHLVAKSFLMVYIKCPPFIPSAMAKHLVLRV